MKIKLVLDVEKEVIQVFNSPSSNAELLSFNVVNIQ